jgi:hypothetical protein
MSEASQHFVDQAACVTAASSPTFDDIYERVTATLEAAEFSGADPFDGLNSRIFAKLPLSSMPVVRLAWLQLFKKSPLDLRALAQVPPSTNPVTLALAARTYLLFGEDEKMRRTVERLIRLRSDPERWGNGAWGYPFAWQAKAFYVPRGVPNVIATAYAVRAVADCSPSTDESDRMIADAAAFVEAELICRSAGGAPYIGYVPKSDTMVHNANLWGAYVLAPIAATECGGRWRMPPSTTPCARKCRMVPGRMASPATIDGLMGSTPDTFWRRCNSAAACCNETTLQSRSHAEWSTT